MGVEELRSWFEQSVQKYDDTAKKWKPYKVDSEQARIILDQHQNVLVKAKAGSGKTHTIIAKIIYLVYLKKVKIEDILVLGFNHNPQEDFKKRLQDIRVYGVSLFTSDDAEQMVKTFHKVASDQARRGNILVDDKDRLHYVEAIINNTIDEKMLYQFVRDERSGPERINFVTDNDYILAAKSASYETLDGQRVRSRAEKIIADFLFEHDIDYTYELSYYPKDLAKYAKNDEDAARMKEIDEIKPDFYLKDHHIIWEHWGIRGNETRTEIEQINHYGVIGEYERYDQRKQFKEWFYRKTWLDETKIIGKDDERLRLFLDAQDFISTHYEYGKSREQFEAEIQELLESHGVVCKKLSPEECLRKFRVIYQRSGVKNITRQVKQFVDRAEQQFPGDLLGLKSACKKETDPYIAKFYQICLKVYQFYLNEITTLPEERKGYLIDQLFPYKKYLDDFGIVLNRAAQIKYNRPLKYLFLDEYQDFSLLFLNLVKNILRDSSNSRVMAVGDDLQAINSYMGADLEYFYNFHNYFKDSTVLQITTNRRSNSVIVDAANAFVANALGQHGDMISSNEGHYEMPAYDPIQDCALVDIKKLAKRNGESEKHRKYNLLLRDIIRDNSGKTIKVLSRTKKINFEKHDVKEVNSFGQQFIEKLRKGGAHIGGGMDFTTVNQAKGQEADVVVILQSDVGIFPVFHPDTKLYKVFGTTEQKALDEQKRLFYVALTRAKEKIYVVHSGLVTNENQPDKNFMKMMELESHQKYQKDDFLPLQKQLEMKKKQTISVIRVDFRQDRYDPARKVNIILTDINGEQVCHDGAYRNSLEYQTIRGIASKLDGNHPRKINVKVSVNSKWKKPYLRFELPQEKTVSYVFFFSSLSLMLTPPKPPAASI